MCLLGPLTRARRLRVRPESIGAAGPGRGPQQAVVVGALVRHHRVEVGRAVHQRALQEKEVSAYVLLRYILT